MTRTYYWKKFINFFCLIIFLISLSLCSPKDIQAQFFPLSYGFPGYAYFNPLINPFLLANFPLLAPPALPPATPFSPVPIPSASIQGTTIYVPPTATGIKISGPGLGQLLSGIIPPATIFIYPSGYVPPAPVTPVPVPPPAPVSTAPVIPTVTPPVITVPATTIAPTSALPSATVVPGAISGAGLLWFNPFLSYLPLL
ncbi:MAG: hypothetical protein ACMUIA_07680 [bacterium]